MLPWDATAALRLLLAAVLGGLVGFERQRRHHPAGLRTHTLVCLGSALIMLVSEDIAARYLDRTNADPARIAAQVVSGIGFLGAGTIMREGLTVRGLTTAAALDCRLRAGIAVPDVVYTNAAKYYFAAHYHEMVKRVQDIAGGLIVTGPAEADWHHPQTRRDLEAYLAGSAHATAEQRLRALNLVRDVTASDFGGYLEVLAIHAEGSLEAQKLTVLMDADLAPYKAYARRLAGIA